jgi:hypothetical protein
MGCGPLGVLGGELPVSVNLKDASTGAPCAADGAVAYTVYEQGAEDEILTGALAVFDATTGHYSANIPLSTANGFEGGNNYEVRITATVSGVALARSYNFLVVTGAQAQALGTAENSNAAVLAAVNARLHRSETTVDAALLAAVRYITSLGNFLSARTTVTLDAGDDSIGVPTDCKSVIAVAIDETVLGLMTVADYATKSDSDSAAEPEYYLPFGEFILFESDADAAYDVEVTYHKYHGSTITTLELGNEFNEAVYCLTTAYVAYGYDLDSQGDKWWRMFGAQMEGLMPKSATPGSRGYVAYTDI